MTLYFCFCIVSFLSVKFNCSKFLQTLLIFICYDMILCNMVLVRIFRTAGAKRASNLLSTRRRIVTVQVNLCQKLLFLHLQYDDILLTELQVQYMKIPSSNMGRTCCVQKLFLTFRTIFIHNMFSPCSAKRRASDKGLAVNWENFISELIVGCGG